MKWYNNYICFGLLLVLLSSNHAMSKRPKDKPAEDSEQNKSMSIVAVASDKEPKTETTLTFLDTINRGREISLTDKDLSQVIPESTEATGTQVVREAGIDGFRIQCLASSQIEKIRAEQKSLESRLKHPIYIIFNAPYYKLLIGDFVKKGDADIVSAKLKDMGYSDAWVTRAKVNPPRQ